MLLKMTDEPEDYEGPWPSEGAMTKPTAEQVMQLANEYAHCYSFVGDDTMPIKHRELRAAIEALAAPAAPVQAEPVWARPDQLRQVPFLCALYKTQAAPDLVPLYRHPPAAEVQRLREAAKRVIAAQSGSAFSVNESINELRRVLEGE